MITAFISLSSIFITSATALIVMLAIVVKRCKQLSLWLTLIGLIVAIGSLSCVQVSTLPPFLFEFFVIDSMARFYMLVILISGIIIALFASSYFKVYRHPIEEFYLLLLLAIVGALLLVCANHFATFFLGLELLSIPTYGLLAYTKEHQKSLEAGLKYLILSATASATLLFGIALIYAQFGTLQFNLIHLTSDYTLHYLSSAQMLHFWFYAPAIFGAALILIAIAFKLSMAPFHQWAPDVYADAPAPVTLFLATVAKIAVFVVLLRILDISLLKLNYSLHWILVLLTVCSILIGNLLALKQANYMKMLALSSVSHMGYALVALICFDLAATNLYLLTYVISSLGTFGVLTLIASPDQKNGDSKSLYGLYHRQPFLAITLTVMLLSLAGIPLTLGFIAKLEVIFAAVHLSDWILVGAVIIGSGISFFYYLKAIILLYTGKIDTDKVTDEQRSKQTGVGFRVNQFILFLLMVAIVGFGVYPDPLLLLLKLIQF